MITIQENILGCDVVAKVYYHRDVFGNYDDTIDDIIIVSVKYNSKNPPAWIDELIGEDYDLDELQETIEDTLLGELTDNLTQYV